MALTSLALLSLVLGSMVQAASVDPGRAAAPAGSALQSVAGTWSLRVETSAGAGTPTVVLMQDGTTLTGTYRGRFGDQPVTGSVSGRSIRFTFRVSGPMGSAQVTYTGTVDGDTMSGTMQMGERMDGRFTGKRTP